MALAALPSPDRTLVKERAVYTRFERLERRGDSQTALVVSSNWNRALAARCLAAVRESAVPDTMTFSGGSVTVHSHRAHLRLTDISSIK